MVLGSLRQRMASPLTGNLVSFLLIVCAASLTVVMLFFAAGCGGSSDDGTPALVLPTASPSAAPSPTPSPIISPIPSPSPTASPSTPPLSGETLTVGQAVIGFTSVTSDTGIPSDPVLASNDGFAIGATNNALGDDGTSAQVFFSDVKNGVVRGVTLVIADRTKVTQGESLTLGPVVSTVKTKNAFVIVTTKPEADKDDSHLKQWDSAGGGTLTVDKLADGQLRLRINDAQMQPRTDVTNNGQAGTFTLNGAGYAKVE